MKRDLKSYIGGLKGLSLSLAMLIGASSPVSAESFNLNLRDSDLQTLVQMVSTVTGRNFVIDKAVRGQKVTIVTGREIDENELYEVFLSVLQMHGLAAIETGSITKIIPVNKSKYQPVPVVDEPTGIPEIDRKTVEPEQDALITKVIKVEHVPVAQLVPILRPMVSPTGHLQGYAPSNSILVTDPASNVDKIAMLIRRMDRPDEDEMEVVILRYASASELVTTIDGLQGAAVQKGVQTKYKVSPDTRTNSVLVSGSKSGRDSVKDIIRRLDRPKVKTAEIQTEVVYLKYALAEDLAKVLSATTGNFVSSEATAKGGAGTQKADVLINADVATNALIIRAEPEIYKNLVDVIKRLDVRRAQVMVEAVIAEVSQELSKSLGVQLGLFNSGSSASPVLSTNYPSSSYSLTDVVSGSLPTSVGALLGLGGTDGSTSFGILLDALSGDSATNVLSTPTLVTMDNVEASMVIGQNVPFLTGSTTTGTDGTSTPFQTIERQDVGITLKIKPQISAGNSIMLKIDQEVSSLAASNASASDLITNTRSFSTQVMVEDGQLLVLGGLMEDTYLDTLHKVPVLGDLPWIGKAFRNTTTTKSKKTLMVFIHPMIMRTAGIGSYYSREKYKQIEGAQGSTDVRTRGLLNSGGAVFPQNPENLLTNSDGYSTGQIQGRAYSSGNTQRQIDLERNARMNQQQANPQVQRYSETPPVRQSTQPLTLAQRQQLAKRNEQIHRQQVEQRQEAARQAERNANEANRLRRAQAAARERQRLLLLEQRRQAVRNGN